MHDANAKVDESHSHPNQGQVARFAWATIDLVAAVWCARLSYEAALATLDASAMGEWFKTAFFTVVALGIGLGAIECLRRFARRVHRKGIT